MAPKHDRIEKDAPGKKEPRKSITLKQKMDILRRYDRGESTVTIRKALNLPESTLCTIRKDREITAVVKAGAGSCSTKVSSGQPNITVRMEKMLVTWMDHRKRQGLNVTFDDTKEKETGPVPEFFASMGWFYKFKTRYGFHYVMRWREAKIADKDATASYPERLGAIEVGSTNPSRFLIWMKRACSGRKCLTARTSRGRRSLPLLLGANLTGDCKLKPVLVYHAKNPRAL